MTLQNHQFINMRAVILFLLLLLYSQVKAMLDYKCLKCLCKTATNCEPEPCDLKACEVSTENYDCACGYFAITPPYWMSTNMPHLEKKYLYKKDKFIDCVQSKRCSIKTVQYYMERFAKDCDGNQVIDCDDYVLIHSFGPGNCENATLKNNQLHRYNTCMDKKDPTTTTAKPKVTPKVTLGTKSTLE